MTLCTKYNHRLTPGIHDQPNVLVRKTELLFVCKANFKEDNRDPSLCVCVTSYVFCVSVPRKRFLGNYYSHHHQIWHGATASGTIMHHVLLLY